MHYDQRLENHAAAIFPGNALALLGGAMFLTLHAIIDSTPVDQEGVTKVAKRLGLDPTTNNCPHAADGVLNIRVGIRITYQSQALCRERL